MHHPSSNNKRRTFFKRQSLVHTIRKVNFLSNNSILTKLQHFHEFFHPNFFWQFFLWNQSCQQLKSPKPQHFHELFTQKIGNFLGKSKLNFWTKNEDFEQCDLIEHLTWIQSDFFYRKHWQTWNDKFMHLKDLIWKTHIYMATLYVDGTDICPWTKLHRKQTKGIENFEKMNVFSPNLPLPQAL